MSRRRFLKNPWFIDMSRLTDPNDRKMRIGTFIDTNTEGTTDSTRINIVWRPEGLFKKARVIRNVPKHSLISDIPGVEPPKSGFKILTNDENGNSPFLDALGLRIGREIAALEDRVQKAEMEAISSRDIQKTQSMGTRATFKEFATSKKILDAPKRLKRPQARYGEREENEEDYGE